MGLYSAAHADPRGVGDARPTALQIVRDECLEGKLKGKVIVITGASSGIGLETARALSATGATLFLAVRDVKKAEAALSNGSSEQDNIVFVEMDNASIASVRAAAATILKRTNNQVNILINNAGIMGIRDYRLTEDGYEMHFATNYLSHFLLFQLLKPALLASATADYHSRVVVVASSAHRSCNLNEPGNYSFERGCYSHELAYAQSKLACVYMANELERRYGHRRLHATSLHPGAIMTNISHNIGSSFLEQLLADEGVRRIMKSPEQGAATTVIAAIGKQWGTRGGKYLENCEEAKRGEDDNNSFGTGFVHQTYNPEAEGRLWKDSLLMLEMEDDD